MNILIVNVHSGLNLGDEAIMQATLLNIWERYPEANIVVAANDPESWMKYPNVKIVESLCHWGGDCRLGIYRPYFLQAFLNFVFLCSIVIAKRWLKIELSINCQKKRDLISAYYQADLVLSCGGGNFYAHHNKSPALFWALMTLITAILLCKPVIMLPQSIGPIEGKIQKHLSRFTFRRINTIMVRERESLQFVKEVLKIDHRKTILLPDLAFGLNGSPTATISEEDCPIRVGITVIDRSAQLEEFITQEIYEESILSLINYLVSKFNCEIHLFAQCYGPSKDQDDRIITNHLFHKIPSHKNRVFLHDHFDNSADIISWYSNMTCVIATRMHSGIFALINNVPVLGIGYQPKTKGMLADYGLENFQCDIGQVSASRLISLVQEMLSNHEAIRQQIIGKNKIMRNSATVWIDYLSFDEDE